MTRSLKALLLAGVAAIGLGIMPGMAAAGHDRDFRGKYGQGGRGEVQRSHGDDRDRRANRGHSKDTWRKDAPRRDYDAPRHVRKHDDGDNLLPFLVIGAVGLTAAILATQSHAAAPARAQRITYVQPPVPAYRPAVAPVYSPAAAPQGPAASCLMTREYQTRITVGGRPVEAYGQACMQPDGSWFYGPAQAAPY